MGIIVPPAPQELSDHRKDKWDFLVFLVLQAYLCTRFVPSDQCQLATYHPFYVQAFIPAFYTLSMIDDLSLISLPLGFYVFETCMYLHLLSHGLLY